MNKKKAKAIFLDRDGTIIRHINNLSTPRQLKFLPGVINAIRLFNRLGFLVFIVSNQPIVARGLISLTKAEKINNILIKNLQKKKAIIQKAYICPHHPNANVKKYRKRCSCRKPAPGMLLQAIKYFKINPQKSFMVGDSIIDVVAGQRAKVKTVLVKTGPGHSRLDKLYSVRPNFKISKILEMRRILNNFNA